MIEIRTDAGSDTCFSEQIPAKWVTSAMEAALSFENRAGDVCVLLTDEDGIQALNRDYRNIDAVTDVLTFPAWEGEELLAPPDHYLGDVAVCVPRAHEQAESFGHSLQREIMFLCVHGALHLLGYDHMNPEDERIMFKKQYQILNEMGVTR